MSAAKHTPGPLVVSVETEWPFKIVTKNAAGDVVFADDMPCHSTSHKSVADVMAGTGIDPKWNAPENNARAVADAVLRAAAPELLEALREVLKHEKWHAAVADEVTPAARAAIKQADAAIAKATGGAQ